MPTYDDERERMLWLMFTRFMNRGYGGDSGTRWFEELELSNGGYPVTNFYPANTPRYALPTVLTIDQIYGNSLPVTPPTDQSNPDIQYIDCHPLYRVSGTPDTLPAYVLVNPDGPIQTEYGERISIIPGCLVGSPGYDPQFQINFDIGGSSPLDLGGAGLPHFDPLSGVLTFDSDPAAQFDPAVDTIEITAWRYIGPSLAARLNSLVGGGPGGVLLSKCDRFLVTPVPGSGNVTNWFPLVVQTSPVTMDTNQTAASLVFVNGNKLILGLDYALRNSAGTGRAEIQFLNDTVQVGRYVVEDCDEAEAYVVLQ